MRPNVYRHPLERFEEPLRDTPEPPPGLPWREVLGWALVGAMLWTGMIWLISRFW